jgi:hypothetical protein
MKMNYNVTESDADGYKIPSTYAAACYKALNLNTSLCMAHLFVRQLINNTVK